MSKGIDLSEWQQPGLNAPYLAGISFAIVRTSHGLTEDKHWRDWYNVLHAKGIQTGFYHFSEPSNPTEEAHFFHDLTDGIPHTYGNWYDLESGQDEHYADALRATYDGGVYSNLDGFLNHMHGVYNRFDRNWVAVPAPNSTPQGISWLLYQELGGSIDHDDGPDARAGIDAHWSSFAWPHL